MPRHLVTRRTLLALLFILFSWQSIAGTDSSAARQQVLQSASELDYPPFAIVQSNGTAGGFSVDLLKAAAEAVGLSVSFKVGAWDVIKQELAEEKIDVLPLVSYSEERNKIYDFTTPYLRMNGTIFVRKDNREIKNIGDLKDKEVLVMRGDTAEEYAAREKLTDNIIPTISYDEAFTHLAAGEHDAVVVQQIVGLQIIKKLHLTNVVPVETKNITSLKPTALKLEGFEQKFCFAVPKGNLQLVSLLNEGLAIITLNGVYNNLYEQWFSPILPEPQIPLEDLLRKIFSIVIPLLLFISLLGLWYLKFLVAKRTRYLELEIEQRQAIEAELAEANVKFEEAQQLGKIGNWGYNVATAEFTCSAEARRIFGLTGDAASVSLEEIEKRLPERERVHQALVDLVERGTPYKLECQINAEEPGDQRTVMLLAALIRDESGVSQKVIGVIQDITERRHAELALQRSEDKFRTVADHIHDWEYWRAPDESFVYMSPSCARITGYSADEFLQDTELLIRIIHPDDRPIFLQHLKDPGRPLASGECQTLDLRILPRHGEERRIEHICRDVFDRKGTYIGRRISNRDVTERRKAEEALNNSNKLLQTIINTAPIRIFYKNKELRYMGCNLAFARDAGLACVEELIGKDDYQLAWKEQAAAYRMDDRKVIESGYSKLSYDEQQTPATGKQTWLRTSKVPLRNEADEIIGILGMYEDITESKQVEIVNARLLLRQRAILDNLPMMAWLKDTESRLEMVNESYAKICGQTVDGCIGKTDLDLFPEKMARRYMADDREVCQSGRKKLTEEAISTPGGMKWHLTYKTPICDEHGQVIGTAGIAQDITERKQGELKYKQLQDQLQQAQKMEAIGTLAGGIAHDFNNILGAILGYAEMAREDCLSGAVNPGDLEQVIQAGNRAKDLVKQILAFSRQSETAMNPVSPASIIKESIKLLRSSLPTTIDIQQDMEPGTALVMADATQFHQIIMNLCTNAYHAMEEKGGTLMISLKNKDFSQQDLATVPEVRAGRFVQLSIKDTGVGIAPGIRERIFDPYFTTKVTGKGTGMGLAIVHGIVKSYGGFITCNSWLGEGTVFEINLPAASEQPAQKQEVDMIPAGTERILFVDDEEILIRMGQTMLERLGYTVTVKTSSLEALTTFTNQPEAFDLVITDQTMPGMTGFDLARRMLQIQPRMPIILCTGYSNQVSEEKAKASGIKGFILKPLVRNDFAVLIRKVLDERKNY